MGDLIFRTVAAKCTAIAFLAAGWAGAASAQAMPPGQPEAEATPAPAPAPVPRAVRIALVNLKDAATAGAIATSEPVRSSWRHTFGAERKTEVRGQRLDPSSWAADVVLIQGFSSLRETRKLFPARGWKLVMPRQLVDAQTTVKQAERPPATAIAVRHRLGLRVAGQELKLDPGTGTAVRLLVAGSPVWLMSAAPVAEDSPAVEAWLDAKKALGEQTVIGGRLPAGLPRDRGSAVEFAPKSEVVRPPTMPVLIASGERRLVQGGTRAYARFPAATPPSPCGGSPGAADAIVVDQQIGDRLKPDTGGWIVTLRKPPPPAAADLAAGPLSASQIRSGPAPAAKPAATAAPAPAPQPAVCVLILDLGV